MFGSVGMTEILIVLGIAVLIFGPRQLPKLGRSLGESIKEFRNVGRELSAGLEDVESEVKDVVREVNK